MSAARWTRHVDVIIGYAGWADDELYAGWVRQTRVIRGIDPDPRTGERRAPPDFTAARGVCAARTRELIDAIAQAYRSVDVPAPADPEFCRIFLGAFRGLTTERDYLPAEGAELPEPPPTFDDASTPAERERQAIAHATRETARRVAAIRRRWHPTWSAAQYVAADGVPAIVDVYRARIGWDGTVYPGGIAESADTWLAHHRGDDARAHRLPESDARRGWRPAPTAGVSAPWTGNDFFIRHKCDRRTRSECEGWHAYVLPAPVMEWSVWCEIADALERRSAQDVMRDAWRWIAHRNIEELKANNMATSEVTDLINQANVDAAKIQQENGLRESARWLEVLGSGAMVAGPYGAIVGTIIKAIATILEAVPIAAGYSLDVWNRRVPAFSRPHLTGSVEREPTHNVEEPPGFVRAVRGRLTIRYPERDAEAMRVQVNGGVWRPSGWSGELPAGVYEVNVEQPGRLPSRLTVRVTAGEEQVMQLRPLARPQNARERERVIADEAERAAAEKIQAEKEREQREQDARERATRRTKSETATGPETTQPGVIAIETPRGAPPGARVRVLSTDGTRELLPWSDPPVSLSVVPGTYRIEWAEAGGVAAARDVIVESLARVAVNLWASRARVSELARKIVTVAAATGAVGVAVYAVQRSRRATSSGEPSASR